jgi:aspartyl-tRNA(Asn)/glutamyl-tRNA(Gln) amidotransferase subunit A
VTTNPVEDTVRNLAATYLGTEPDEATVEEVAARLRGLLRWLAGVDRAGAVDLEPAGVFDAAAAVRSVPPPDGGEGLPPSPGVWKSVTATAYAGASGYAAPRVAAPRHTSAPTGSEHGPEDGPHGATIAAIPAAPLPPSPSPLALSLSELARLIRRREISPVEVTQAALARIDELDGRLRAFITVDADAAVAQARAVETALARRDAPEPGPLAGVPIAVKDIIRTAGLRTTCGSRILADHIPERDATVVTLLRRAGAVIVGKANTHEFAFGATNINPHYGACVNPWDPRRVSGGSSGGSAVAVATGMAYGALGTDTGGSIRIPAAACGVVGLKPTYGRVSRYGVFPLSWSLDHVGPLARTVADAALLLEVLAGPDPLDPTAVTRAAPDLKGAVARAADGLRGLRAGVPRAWLDGRIEPGVLGNFQFALTLLEKLGAEIVEVDYPAAGPMMLTNRLLALAEAAAFHTPWLAARSAQYGRDVLARLRLGQYILAGDYLLGQRLRGELARAAAGVMARVDVVVTPALPIVAPEFGRDFVSWDGEEEAVPDALIRFAAPINVTGQPAISVPCGLAAGLPVGLQIVGRVFDEETVLRVAAAFEAGAAPMPPSPLP